MESKKQRKNFCFNFIYLLRVSLKAYIRKLIENFSVLIENFAISSKTCSPSAKAKLHPLISKQRRATPADDETV